MNQDPPFTIKIELTEGCNLRCSFCGINGIRDKERTYKFLSVKNAGKLAFGIYSTGWRSKLEFTMHGEPLMNPDYLKILKIFREALPDNQIMVSTNSLPLLSGGGVVRNTLELFDYAHIDILVVDCYDIARKAWSVLLETDFEPYRIIKTAYPGGPSPNKRFNRGERRIVMIEDLAHVQTEENVTGDRMGNRIISNHIGAAAPVGGDLPWSKRCARPFREFCVRRDGRVALCCNDWRGEYKCGSVLDEDMIEVWNNIFFNAARKMLYNKDRNFGPCAKCDNVSFRVGLLPDKLGKKSLPLPSKKDREAIAEATKGRSYTMKILREWEKK